MSGRKPETTGRGGGGGFDPQVFGRGMVAIIKGYFAREIAPLEARIAELEARAGIAPPRGKSKRARP